MTRCARAPQIKFHHNNVGDNPLSPEEAKAEDPMTNASERVTTDPYKHMTVKHHFIGGIYTKECHLPVGFRFEQHRHSFAHQSVLVSGTATIEVDGEKLQYTGPAVLTIAAKKVHSVTPLTPVVWLCQHVTACTDPDDIDIELIDRGEA